MPIGLFFVNSPMILAADDPLKVDKGQLTFDAEGTEGGAFHSRKASVPSKSSGLTIGRGYDMKEKTAKKIEADMKGAGVAEKDAKVFARSAGLSGTAAEKFLADHKLELVEISKEQQKKLFVATYDELEADVKRICAKDDVVAKYGNTDWDKLNVKIREVLVDLRYRGDYHTESRMKIQALVAKNDLPGFTKVLSDKEAWKGVPKDRFERRKTYLE